MVEYTLSVDPKWQGWIQSTSL